MQHGPWNHAHTVIITVIRLGSANILQHSFNAVSGALSVSAQSVAYTWDVCVVCEMIILCCVPRADVLSYASEPYVGSNPDADADVPGKNSAQQGGDAVVGVGRQCIAEHRMRC